MDVGRYRRRRRARPHAAPGHHTGARGTIHAREAPWERGFLEARPPWERGRPARTGPKARKNSDTDDMPQPPNRPHKTWHSRGYLPHLDQPGTVQFITFRLADAVPTDVVAGWRAELKLSGEEDADDPRSVELRKRIERYADQGHGACWLRDDRIAAIVQDALLHFDGERYRLLRRPDITPAQGAPSMPGRPPGNAASWKRGPPGSAGRVGRVASGETMRQPGPFLGARASCPLEHTGGPSAHLRAGRPRSQGAHAVPGTERGPRGSNRLGRDDETGGAFPGSAGILPA